ncbi:alkaline phosphatase family protein [Nocardioides hwasunensis]|uniref:Alkaline phosphatase family protein n=1 Tax=Nocardioides hwasunensis TaxID=397258 RepID=A0ABR8MA46_9ACTN|nr:alkaline phosphatase family protein [Nocardioides hwasunensis]MBD3913032.1 alkaline phosphatase family protein [Nocardioides hwasunensis]
MTAPSVLVSLLASASLVLAGAPACAVVSSADTPPAAPTSGGERRVAQQADSESVLAISIDGMSVPAVRKLGRKQLPNLYRFMKVGASTLNARTEREMTVTLPNHTGMVTGRRIDAATGGHGVTWNDDRPTPSTVQAAAGHDVASVFSAVDAAGGSTALFAAKTKFSLWQRSWPDAIDRTTIDLDNSRLVTQLIKDLDVDRDFRFLHLSLPDNAGHKSGWMSKPYLRAVRRSDALVGRVVKAVNADPARKAGTTILLTSDHGGHGPTHSNARLLDNYRIVFMARGSAVDRGVDLYDINPTYKDPGTRRTVYGQRRPPVRNGMIANLALDLLDLPPVEGSEFDVEHDLRLTAAP